MGATHRFRRAGIFFLGMALTTGVGCKTGGSALSAPAGVAIASLTVTSRSFQNNGTIPVDYTCDGTNKSPGLTWSAPPEHTSTFAVVMTDPDAPGGTFTHWVLYNVPGTALSLAENLDPATIGAAAGLNDGNQVGYTGPCPPKMEIHRYEFHVFALDALLPLKSGASKGDLASAMNGHVLAEGVLVGLFSH